MLSEKSVNLSNHILARAIANLSVGYMFAREYNPTSGGCAVGGTQNI
jgi:hypothetical protein